ncbi:MAG: sigma-70 family RNA polymerase sigma factor [Turneriella sp.]
MSAASQPDQLLQQIYSTEAPKLYGYLVKKTSAELAQDIMQEAFTRLYTKLQKAAPIHNTRAYLFQIARHLLYHETRMSGRIAGGDAVLENRAAPVTSSDPDRLEERELIDTLKEAVSVLTPAEKEIFDLRWENGLTQVEIAEVLGKSERQIRRDLEKVVNKLRAHFGSKGWGHG